MKKTMNMFTIFLLSALSPFALAQRGGSAIHSFGHSGHVSAGVDSRQGLALRATDTQRDAFARCVAATEAVRKTGRLMGDSNYWNSWRYRHLGYDLGAVSGRMDQFQAALTDLAAAHQQFLQELDSDQKAELSPNLNKLERLQSELNSQMSQLDREVAADRPDSFRVSTRVYGIGKAIDKWRSQHKKIAKAMSLPL
jgi:hypothetical protein